MDFNEKNDENKKQPPTDERMYTPEDEHLYTAEEITAPATAAKVIHEHIITERPQKKRRGLRVFVTLILIFSILVNCILFAALVGTAATSFASDGGIFNESVIVESESPDKIVVIRIEGAITGETSQDVRKQIKTAAKDKSVKALIIRTITPGGGVAASDQIHHEITKFREKTGKPVVAFMQTVAASGGYYTSVACNKIVAEPTVITGSIGVIAHHMVLKQLLEEKLGITPVVIKSGPRKDWPSPFSETTEEQIEYLQEKLIRPAYNRFAALVDQGRENLDIDQVRILADGSIYGADEALENGLIDKVGYIDTAIDTAKELAGIKAARVVEYVKQFSIMSVLGAERDSIFSFDRDTLHEWTTPEVLYLWDGRR
jgi:protease-4